MNEYKETIYDLTLAELYAACNSGKNLEWRYRGYVEWHPVNFFPLSPEYNGQDHIVFRIKP